MHPYAARQLLTRVRDADLGELREQPVCSPISRSGVGGTSYGERLALTLALRRAAGAAS